MGVDHGGTGRQWRIYHWATWAIPPPFELRKNLTYGKKSNQNAPFSGKNLKNFLGRGTTHLSGSNFESRVAPLFHWVATLGKLFTQTASPAGIPGLENLVQH